MNTSLSLKVSFLFLLTGAAALVSLHSGSVSVTWDQVFSGVFHRPLDQEHEILLGTLRIPRILAAFFIGASLGTCGIVLQTLLKNPLAEPYTLGLSGGSSLGAIAALSLALEPSSLWIPILSSAGCLAAAAVVLGLGRRQLEFESRSLILFGVTISLFFGALVVSGLSVLSPQKLQTALFWLLGEFGTGRDLWIYNLWVPLFLGMIAIFSRAGALDALSLGETGALSLGYSPSRERFLLIFLCTALTSLSVSISGLVGFVGLVSPHIARKFLKTSRHAFLIAASALIGAFILIVADTVGRTIAGDTEIPAGSIAALIGAPVLIYFLMGEKMLRLNDVWAGYGKNPVIKGLDLQIQKNETLTFIGLNGSGKSTVLKTILGLIPTSRGSVELDGTPIKSLSLKERAQKVSLLDSQPTIHFPMSVAELLRLAAQKHGAQNSSDFLMKNALDAVGLSGFEKRNILELSSGESKRALLAHALCGNSAVIMLDEPLSHLDWKHQRELISNLLHWKKQFGSTFVLALHELEWAVKISDRLCVLHQGKLLRTGLPQEVLSAPEVREVFAFRCLIDENPIDGTQRLTLGAQD